nr:MAG TPA: O-Antigen ligase [Caudoviricetes sp.]
MLAIKRKRILETAENSAPSLWRTSFSSVLVGIYLFASIFLPSGKVFDVNIKLLLLVVVLGAMVIDKRGKPIVKLVSLLILPIVYLILEMSLSVLTFPQTDLMVSQAIQIAVFYLIIALPFAVYSKDELGTIVTNLVVSSVVCVGIFKILIIAYATLKGVPVTTIVVLVARFFSANIMTYDLDDVALARINMPADIVLYGVMLFLVNKIFKDGLNIKLLAQVSIVAFSALITMSRFQWAGMALAVALALMINIRNKKSVAIIFSGLILVIGALSTQTVQDILASRLDSKASSASDVIRDTQEKAIDRQIEMAPMLGHGMGSYAPDLIRSLNTPYSYELQIPAMIMQLGYIGTFMFFGVTLIPIIYSFSHARLSYIICGSIIYAWWILGGFFNPSIYSSSGGATLLFLCLMPFSPYFRRR